MKEWRETFIVAVDVSPTILEINSPVHLELRFQSFQDKRKWANSFVVAAIIHFLSSFQDYDTNIWVAIDSLKPWATNPIIFSVLLSVLQRDVDPEAFPA